MTAFRQQPGEYIRAVVVDGASFLLTKSGKPAAYLSPPPEVSTSSKSKGRKRK